MNTSITPLSFDIEPQTFQTANMAIFPAKRFRPSSYESTLPSRYRAALAKHPFMLFGLPFIATMVMGSFFLTPATAIRYEKHDRKVKQVTEEEKLGFSKDRRRVDLKEEYYVRTLLIRAKMFARLRLTKARNSPPKTWRTGSKKESRDCPVNTMAFSKTLSSLQHGHTFCSATLARRYRKDWITDMIENLSIYISFTHSSIRDSYSATQGETTKTHGRFMALHPR